MMPSPNTTARTCTAITPPAGSHVTGVDTDWLAWSLRDCGSRCAVFPVLVGLAKEPQPDISVGQDEDGGAGDEPGAAAGDEGGQVGDDAGPQGCGDPGWDGAGTVQADG